MLLAGFIAIGILWVGALLCAWALCRSSAGCEPRPVVADDSDDVERLHRFRRPAA
jgi:hypothetical protein